MRQHPESTVPPKSSWCVDVNTILTTLFQQVTSISLQTKRMNSSTTSTPASESAPVFHIDTDFTTAQESSTSEVPLMDASATSTDSHYDFLDVASCCGLSEIGFLFEGNQATQRQLFAWDRLLPGPNGEQKIQVILDSNEAEPGAVISGHYLWPAAELLVQFLCTNKDDATAVAVRDMHVGSIVELGAGCALISLAALQLWQSSLQCLVTTDYDPGVLERARSNYESTLESKLDASMTEDQFNSTINNLGSIPVCFEILEWGNMKDIQRLQQLISEHSTHQCDRADLVLGSDLIYSFDVVEPLLTTAAELLCVQTNDSGQGEENLLDVPRFLLSQSFAYDKNTEELIDTVCEKLGLQRTILLEQEDGQRRIQEFRRKRRIADSKDELLTTT